MSIEEEQGPPGSTLNSFSQHTMAARLGQAVRPPSTESEGLAALAAVMRESGNAYTGTPGVNASGENGGTKNDEGKPDFSLIPYYIQEEQARVLMHGARKYGRDNWMKGFDFNRLMRAAQGHLLSWWWVDDNDPETGLSHLAHARCMIDFLYENHRAGVGKDNRPPVEVIWK